MLFDDVAATSAAVAAASGRGAKTDAIADLFRRADPADAAIAATFLVGDPRQGRTGVGWATLRDAPAGSAAAPSLAVGDVDESLSRLASTSGPGLQAARRAVVADLFARATAREGDFLRRLLMAEMRHGALDAVVLDAAARAADVPVAAVRRAAMLTGDLGRTVAITLGAGSTGLAAVGLEVGRPVMPMLASPATDVADALGTGPAPAAVEAKLDGVRIQLHRRGDDVAVFTRNLNDVTARLPEVVALARSLPVDVFVLDGELVGISAADAPQAFQDTMSRFGRDDAASSPTVLRPHFFDVLHAGGDDLIDEPLAIRRDVLAEVASHYVVDGTVTADPAAAARFLDATVAAGNEGVVIKALASTYAAGRRGKSWRKVKPVHTLDLVVLAAEWGHGRRTGLLSNLHLGARDPTGGPPVMVGRTFKGLTDAMLASQTEALLAREAGRDGIVVFVRPELVVEVAVDGVQTSTRYPGGVALRFARVRRYRDDKPAAAADTLDAVRALEAGTVRRSG